MKFKMSDKSLFAILLRSPWWISFSIVVVFILASNALLPKDFVAYGVIGGFPFLVIACIAAWRQWKLPSAATLASTLSAVQAMSWGEFSSRLEQGFVRQGYTVSQLSGAGADLMLTRSGRTTLVACKRWKAATLGVEPLRELVKQRDTLQAQACLLISLGQLSENARSYAAEQGIRSLDLPELTRLVNS